MGQRTPVAGGLGHAVRHVWLVHETISIDLANAILFTAFAVTWTGARVFDGRNVQPVYLFGGAIVWLLACRMPLFQESIDARVCLARA